MQECRNLPHFLKNIGVPSSQKFNTVVAVEVLGVSTRVGHRRCAHAFLHVGTHKVIAWALCSYIRSECREFALSV